MGKFNTLCRGTPSEVIDLLQDECDEQELRAALENAMRRIEQLEAFREKIEKLAGDR